MEPPVDVGGQFADQSSLRRLIAPVWNTSVAQFPVGKLIQLPRISRRNADPAPENHEPCVIVNGDEQAKHPAIKGVQSEAQRRPGRPRRHSLVHARMLQVHQGHGPNTDAIRRVPTRPRVQEIPDGVYWRHLKTHLGPQAQRVGAVPEAHLRSPATARTEVPWTQPPGSLPVGRLRETPVVRHRSAHLGV